MQTYNIFTFSFEELSDAAKLAVERNFKELDWDFPPSTFEGYNFTKDGDFCMLPSDAVLAPEKILFEYNELHKSVKYKARITVATAANSDFYAGVPTLDLIYNNPGMLFLKDGTFVNHLNLF